MIQSIPLENLNANSIDLWKNHWFLLTAGTLEKNNMMTVSWGSLGYMWNRPFAQIVVRPQRHTFNFTEEFDTFTLCAFPDDFQADLTLLGTKSGRHENKLDLCSIHYKASQRIPAPGYEEAELILECKKIYRQKMDPTGFLDASIQNNYALKDYHIIYYGEIVHASGTKEFRI
jgi:flavin reductase (DIM6/NTAB) family NADH-FMN oxidoreductase RutF